MYWISTGSELGTKTDPSKTVINLSDSTEHSPSEANSSLVSQKKNLTHITETDGYLACSWQLPLIPIYSPINLLKPSGNFTYHQV
jgi:hypothetical protein